MWLFKDVENEMIVSWFSYFLVLGYHLIVNGTHISFFQVTDRVGMCVFYSCLIELSLIIRFGSYSCCCGKGLLRVTMTVGKKELGCYFSYLIDNQWLCMKEKFEAVACVNENTIGVPFLAPVRRESEALFRGLIIYCCWAGWNVLRRQVIGAVVHPCLKYNMDARVINNNLLRGNMIGVMNASILCASDLEI